MSFTVLLSASRHRLTVRGSVARMSTHIEMTGGGRSAAKIVQESVEDVTRLIREASNAGDKFVVLTREDGGKVALIAADVVQITERPTSQ